MPRNPSIPPPESYSSELSSAPRRDARLNAKIDSAAGTVVMGTSFQTAYEANLENAKALSSRTFMLANAVGAVSRA